MNGWKWLIGIPGGLAILGVCLMGAAWLGALARQGVRDVRAWSRQRREERDALGDIPNCKTRRAMRAAERGKVHLLNQMRQGKTGI